MSYPFNLYKGQNTIKRTLTMPLEDPAFELDLRDMVTVNEDGYVVPYSNSAAKYTNHSRVWMVLQSINRDDDTCVVDFSGVHAAKASEAIRAGQQIRPINTIEIEVGTKSGGTAAIALTRASAGESIAYMFLN